MSIGAAPDPKLVDMFRGLRADSRSDPTPAELSKSFVITIGFDGAGSLPTVGQCQILDLGQLKARITGAAIVANGIGSATIDLRHGTFADVPTLATIYSGLANIPTLTAAASAVLDTTTWTLNLQPADVLIATLMTVSSVTAPPTFGALTSVTLSIHCRHLKWPAGTSGLTDTGGNALTTGAGDPVTLRS